MQLEGDTVPLIVLGGQQCSCWEGVGYRSTGLLVISEMVIVCTTVWVEHALQGAKMVTLSGDHRVICPYTQHHAAIAGW